MACGNGGGGEQVVAGEGEGSEFVILLKASRGPSTSKYALPHLPYNIHYQFHTITLAQYLFPNSVYLF